LSSAISFVITFPRSSTWELRLSGHCDWLKDGVY
jgi:hypothetical protein